MAKIRVAQIKDLSLENGVITIGAGNAITPLTTVAPLAETGKVVSGFTVSGNTITPTFTTISFDGYATEEFVGNAISTALADYSTTEQMNSAISTALADYSTTEQMNSAISTATTDMATKTWVNGQFDTKLADMATKTWVGTTLTDYVLKTSINTTDTLATTSTSTIPSEKTVAAYVAAELAQIDTQAYTAGNGIDIANHVVSAVVKSGDKVLSVDANGLQTTIGIEYDETSKEIKLVGINGEQIGEAIDATAFIKDGMLKSVELDGTDLVLTWNTDGDPDESGVGGDVVRVPLGSLVDVYTADETYIKLGTDNKFSHVVQNVDTGVFGGKTDNLNFEIPTVQVDKAGHVTTINKATIAIPTATSIASTAGTGLATEGAVKNYVDSKVPKEVIEGEISVENSKLFRTNFTGQYCDQNMGINASGWTLDQHSVCVYINGQLIPDNDGDNYTINNQDGNWSINVSRNQFDAEGSDFTVENTDRIDVVAYGTQYKSLKVLQFKQENPS